MYARETSVPVERTRVEIEQTLARYGATAFAYASEGNRAMVAFKIQDRQVRIVLPLPDRNDKQFTHVNTWRKRAAAEAESRYAQVCRSRWRALLLVIKAKLEAVTSGISTIENEFLAFVVLPDGRTVGEWTKPQLELAYSSGEMPKMLPGGQ